MAVIIMKEEKINKVLEALADSQNEEVFKIKFKEKYPEDYAKIVKTYEKEERKDKKGKGHPMPHPETYLSNMFKVAMNKKNK